MKRFAFIAVSFLCSSFLRAQETTTFETNPTFLKWYQINTDHFRVLYPSGFEQQAQRMANTLEHIREPEARTLGVRPRKISVLLQNQSSISNGFVTLAPRRSEFFAMPSQNYNLSGTNDWLDMLASHEYRHIVQYQRSITGFNKLLYFFFGQQALSGMSFVNTPQWFWEGDAVATETAFTHSGRGRIPNFDLLFRTHLLEGRTFGYHKLYLRSYKDNIPDHYVLGYHMVSYLRKRTGDPEIWEKISRRSWNVPFLPFRFSNSIKANSGLSVKDLYNVMSADLRLEWQRQVNQLNITSFDQINSTNPTAYTDYMYPQLLEDGSVIALKSGIGDISQLVMLSENGRERREYTPGPLNVTGMLSAQNDRVVWNEYRYDPRWLMRTYSVIKGYDFTKRKSRVISKHSRYAGAALSPDGKQVVTVQTGTDYKTSLVILDYDSGRVIKELSNPDNDFISMARFTEDGASIVAIRQSREGKTITKYEIAMDKAEDLIPVTKDNIGYPVMHKHYLFFNSPISGIDNIYVTDTITGKRFQITSSKYGAYNPVISRDGQTIYYNEQGRNGMNVVKIPFDPFYWRPMEEVQEKGIDFYQHLVEQEGRPGLFDSVPSNQYSTRRYSKLKGIINPHSWGAYVNSDFTSLNAGIISQDVLSTTTISAGYGFDRTEGTGSWNARVSYQGFYPVLDFKFSEGKRNASEALSSSRIAFNWTERNVQGGVRIPLVTTHSKYISKVEAGNVIGLTHVSDFKNGWSGVGRLVTIGQNQYLFRNYVSDGDLIYNQFTFSAYRLLKQSRRDINSKWGQSLTVNSYSTPFGGNFNGGGFSVLGIAYFPGLFKHHSLWGYWGYQQTRIEKSSLDNYLFRNAVPVPRGQSVSRFQDFYTLSANYTLPIWYPDIAIGPLINFQRVRVNAFVDYASGKSTAFNVSQTYSSIGGELKFDVNIMRFLPQWNFGFRYSYLEQTRTANVEFILGSIGF